MYLPGVPSNVTELTGPQLLGFLFNIGLFGILSVQVYIYHLCFVKDPWQIRTVVYSLYIWESAQTVLVIHDAFAILGSGWGDLDKLQSLETLWFNSPIMTGLVSLTVQCFFAWRILVLGRSRIVAIIIVMVALTSTGAAMAGGILGKLNASDDSQLHETTFVATTLWLAASAVCDILICVCMCWYLGRAWGRTSSRMTSGILTRIIFLTVGTGVMTACTSAIDCALFLTFQDNNLHMCPALALGKLYSNSLMVLLNNRLRIQHANVSSLMWDDQRADHSSDGALSLGRRHFSAGTRWPNRTGLRTTESTNGMTVRVDIQTEEHTGIELDQVKGAADTVHSVSESKTDAGM